MLNLEKTVSNMTKAVTDHEKPLEWQEHYERLLNEEFDWNKALLALNDPTIGPLPSRHSEKSFGQNEVW